MQTHGTKGWNAAEMQGAGHAAGDCNKVLTAAARILPAPKLLNLQQLSYVHGVQQL